MAFTMVYPRSFLRSTSSTNISSLFQTTPRVSSLPFQLYAQRKLSNMSSSSGLQKQLLSEGNKKDYPQKGDEVAMHYTGWLFDQNAPQNRGTQFDSSEGRGDFKTAIGVGRVIPGWDQGVPTMSLGEKSVLTIPGDMAYGDRGFPGLIPPKATLVFEVILKGINGKRA